MSAIAGLFGRICTDASAAEHLAKMLAALGTRAAGKSTTFATDVRVKLGVRAGVGGPAAIRQSRDGRYHAVCDGVVFNRQELGARLRGSSPADDTDLLVNLVATDGIEAFKRVDGQFAVAIWDRLGAELTIVRDFLGVI